MKEVTRYAICIIIGYIVLWYAGAMFDFFPFPGDPAGFAGLLIVIVIVICTCWIIDTIQNKDR